MDGTDIDAVPHMPYDGGAKLDSLRYVDDCSPTAASEEPIGVTGVTGEKTAKEDECHNSAPHELNEVHENKWNHSVAKPAELISDSNEVKNADEHHEKTTDYVVQSIDGPTVETLDKEERKMNEDRLYSANQGKDGCDPGAGKVADKLPSDDTTREVSAIGKSQEICSAQDTLQDSLAPAKEISERSEERPTAECVNNVGSASTPREQSTATVECDVIVSREGTALKGTSKSFLEKSMNQTAVSVEIAMNQAPSDSLSETARSQEGVTHKEKASHTQDDTTAASSDSLTPPEKPTRSHVAVDGAMPSEAVVLRSTTASCPPTPPPRRNSMLPDGLPPSTPTPTMRSMNRQPSISSSRTNTMNYNYALGRLSFPTLPRNARPPRRGERFKNFHFLLVLWEFQRLWACA